MYYDDDDACEVVEEQDCMQKIKLRWSQSFGHFLNPDLRPLLSLVALAKCFFAYLHDTRVLSRSSRIM